MKKLLDSKLVAWLSFLFWLGVIFYLSSRPAFVVSSQEEIDNLAHIVAHMGEYALLAVLSLHLFRFYLIDLPAYLLTFFFDFFYSLSDEWHQKFVPTRQSSLGDVAADVGGVILILILFRWILRRWNEKT